MTVHLKDFGSYTAGGKVVEISGRPVQDISFTADTRYLYDPNGAFPVENAYVQYFVPETKSHEYPVVLLHGGGLTGAMWETTPDGRPGWLHRLLEAGFEVHVVDNVERGRAGWMPDYWDGAPILRNLQEAWTLFRFGSAEGFAERRPHDGQQFPVENLTGLANLFVPRWTTTTTAQVSAFTAVLERIGRCTVIAHSQGGEIASQAAAENPTLVANLLLVEPSGMTNRIERLAKTRLVIAHGDFLDQDDTWRGIVKLWNRMIEAHRRAGGNACLIDLADGSPGVSHMPMMDSDSDRHLRRLLQVLDRRSCSR